MKKVFFVFLISFLASPSFASGLNWLTDFEKAKAQAREENKKILINFTGSDWCGWCKRLAREVFDKEGFSKFASDELVLLFVDFPRYKAISAGQREVNQKLANHYRIAGFPTILLVDENEKVLLKTGYRAGGYEKYIHHLKPFLTD